MGLDPVLFLKGIRRLFAGYPIWGLCSVFCQCSFELDGEEEPSGDRGSNLVEELKQRLLATAESSGDGSDTSYLRLHPILPLLIRSKKYYATAPRPGYNIIPLMAVSRSRTWAPNVYWFSPEAERIRKQARKEF